MKGTLLKVFAALLVIVGALMLLLVAVFGWGTWNQMPGGVGWFDLQLSNKVHIPFMAKAVTLLPAAGLIWIRGRKRQEDLAKRTAMVLFGVGLAFAAVGTYLCFVQQADLFYRNESTVQTVRTILYVLIFVLLIVGSVGLLAREIKAFWLLSGVFTLGICINLATLFVIITYPIIMSGHDTWLTRWGVEALFFLALNVVAMCLLFWMRSELGPPEKEFNQGTDGKSPLRLT